MKVFMQKCINFQMSETATINAIHSPHKNSHICAHVTRLKGGAEKGAF